MRLCTSPRTARPVCRHDRARDDRRLVRAVDRSCCELSAEVTPHARPARSTQTYDACAVQQRARTHVAPQPSFIRRRPPLASPPSGLAPQLGAPPCTARTPGYRAATGRAGTLLLAARAQYESPVLQLRSRTCVLSDRARAPYLAGRRSRCRKVFRVYATQPVRPLYTPP